ncbi:MAG TPA: PAS domain-containing protein [Candidatus Omnitrophota bacterium]|mgnify:CR=1 FL=1|nr:PAS domain-containing protein [Candidatus Omnitrophota bacterium]HPB69180.1 PAS domain-containing protein [Candidatus Omnitrophota bacterium]HQO58114.1 PAS domain-containing protein [Candidatus Omnitrophota bacterium]HQP11811.1 PAS domain-containing protein [Candidatus Omnitrophota bacterium]
MLSALVDYLPDPCFVIDRDKIVIAWNRAREQLTGVGRETMLGKLKFVT